MKKKHTAARTFYYYGRAVMKHWPFFILGILVSFGYTFCLTFINARVVADIIDAAKSETNVRSLYWNDDSTDFVEPFENISSSFMLRLKGSVEAYKSVVSDTGTVLLGNDNEFAVITSQITESEIKNIEERLAELNVKVLSKIRVLDY